MKWVQLHNLVDILVVLIIQFIGTVRPFTNITALPIPFDASTFLDIAKNEHIPKKYASKIFSIKIDFVAKLK